MNSTLMNAPRTREELELELKAVLGDLHFLEMLINNEERMTALRKGAPAQDSDEKQFVDALKRINDLRKLLEKK